MISDRLASSTSAWLSNQSDVFKEAFAWLRAMPASVPNGIIELRGRAMYAQVQGYQTQSATECRWESHRRHIDIHCVFEGGERIDYQRPGVLAPDHDYDEENDVEFWHPSVPPAASLALSTGTYVIFLAGEPHRPRVANGVQTAVRKVVMKIDAALIS